MHIATIRSSVPRPLAHYNECFTVGPWVFAAGQIASDYQPMVLVSDKPSNDIGILQTKFSD